MRDIWRSIQASHHAHQAVVAEAVEVRPAEQHVAGLVAEGVEREAVAHRRHHVAAERDAVGALAGVAGVRPQALAPLHARAGVDDVDRVGVARFRMNLRGRR